MIAYITMSFPVKSEAFACVEVGQIVRSGADVTVFELKRPSRKQALDDDRLDEWGLSSSIVSHRAGTIRYIVSFFVYYAFMNGLARLYHLAKDVRPGLQEFLKLMALLPRAEQVAGEIINAEYKVVHAFWGHYPSIVLYILHQNAFTGRMSMFLGAYDLKANLRISKHMAQKLSMQPPSVITHCAANIPNICATMGVAPNVIKVVYRGVETSCFDYMQRAHAAGSKKFVCAGRLIRKKRVDLAIHAFSKILNNVPDCEILFAGDGPDAYFLKCLAERILPEGSYKFIGHVSQAELMRIFSQSEFLLMPSLSDTERLPNVVKEAMLMGCIPISNKTVGIEELIEDQRSGFIVDYNDPNSVASLISSVINNDDLMRSIRTAGYKKVIEDFSVRSSVSRLFSVWGVRSDGL